MEEWGVVLSIQNEAKPNFFLQLSHRVPILFDLLPSPFQNFFFAHLQKKSAKRRTRWRWGKLGSTKGNRKSGTKWPRQTETAREREERQRAKENQRVERKEERNRDLPTQGKRNSRLGTCLGRINLWTDVSNHVKFFPMNTERDCERVRGTEGGRERKVAGKRPVWCLKARVVSGGWIML